MTAGGNHPPEIASGPTATPNPAQAGQSVAFLVVASDADGDALSCAWTFGDGASGTGFTPAHTYAAAGSYTATVTVSDGKGGTATDQVAVVVTGGNGAGDLNGDKVVNIDDLTLVTSHFGQTSASPGWDARADANGDGVVNIDDLTEVTSNFGKSY
jgi:PKD repeat protein